MPYLDSDGRMQLVSDRVTQLSADYRTTPSTPLHRCVNHVPTGGPMLHIRSIVLAALVALAFPVAASANGGKMQYVLAIGDSATAGTQAIAPPTSPGAS